MEQPPPSRPWAGGTRQGWLAPALGAGWVGGLGGERRSELLVSIPVRSSPGEADGALQMRCESGLNFNHPQGLEK